MSTVMCVKWDLLQDKQNSWVLLWLTICLAEHVVCVFPLLSASAARISPSIAFCFHEQIQYEVNIQTLSTTGGKWARIGEWHWVGEWHMVGSALLWRLRKECAEKGEERRNVSDCEGAGPLYAREVMRNRWSGGWWKSSIVVCMEHKIHGIPDKCCQRK